MNSPTDPWIHMLVVWHRVAQKIDDHLFTIFGRSLLTQDVRANLEGLLGSLGLLATVEEDILEPGYVKWTPVRLNQLVLQTEVVAWDTRTVVAALEEIERKIARWEEDKWRLPGQKND